MTSIALLLNQFSLSISLSLFAGLSTGIGGLLVINQDIKRVSFHSIGIWQAGAAGFMISVSLLEILPGLKNANT